MIKHTFINILGYEKRYDKIYKNIRTVSEVIWI